MAAPLGLGTMKTRAYYNEIDPYAAEWLENLILDGQIAMGDVDTRSIEDVRPDDLAGYTQCHFFAGIGVWSYSLRLAGWSDSRPAWTGSCPCQPFSQTGRGAGVEDDRHLWPSLYWLISQQRPEVVFGEQVASKDGLAWLDAVLSDLENEKYACTAVDSCAAGFGAPHVRQRLYWVGDTHDTGLERHTGNGDDAARRSQPDRPASPTSSAWNPCDWLSCRDGKSRPVQPGTFPMAHGVAARMGRLCAYGNAIVAPQAAEFIKAYMEC